MPTQPQPMREFFPIRLGGVLDESSTPSRTGTIGMRAMETGSDVGLTKCENLVYRRFGSWGKRAGSTLVFVPPQGGGPAPQPPPTPAPPAPPFSPPLPNPPTPPGPPLPPGYPHSGPIS